MAGGHTVDRGRKAPPRAAISSWPVPHSGQLVVALGHHGVSAASKIRPAWVDVNPQACS